MGNYSLTIEIIINYYVMNASFNLVNNHIRVTKVSTTIITSYIMFREIHSILIAGTTVPTLPTAASLSIVKDNGLFYAGV